MYAIYYRTLKQASGIKSKIKNLKSKMLAFRA